MFITVHAPCTVKQINTSATFTRIQDNGIFDIYHSLNRTSKYVIYLLECSICKRQYVGKSKTQLHKKLNNQRKDIKEPSPILLCKHFNSPNYDFNTHGKFTVIDQLINITLLPTDNLKESLKQRETFGLKN